MANPQDRQIDIAGQQLTVRFSLRAMLALKDAWGLKDDRAVEARIQAADSDDFPTILWAALRTHHPEYTVDGVLGLLDDAGVDGMADVAAQMEKAAQAAQPPPGPRRGQGRTQTPTP